jgi:hypothetical protein
VKAIDVIRRTVPESVRRPIRGTALDPFRVWHDIKAAARVCKGGREAFQRTFFDRRTNILSYPKSGRTWLRILLGDYLRRHYALQTDQKVKVLDLRYYREQDARVPNIRFSHDDNPQLKTRQQLENDKTRFADRKVVFLSRDPRDILISNYFHETHRETKLGCSTGFSGTLHDFLHHDIHGIETIIAYMNVWARARHIPKQFLLIRYEDMSKDAANELCRILAFLAINPIRMDDVHCAAATGNFDNMQQMEKQNILNDARLRATQPDVPESFKVRRGKVGGYVDYLDTSDTEYVNQQVRMHLDPFFGYSK